MKTFWQWMIGKGYANSILISHNYNIKDFFLIDDVKEDCAPTSQMLIGYMIEYLREITGKLILPTIGGRVSVHNVYEWYEQKIKESE